MSILGYLTRFNSSPSITLHNGTTIINKSVIENSAEAVIEYIRLPNYVLYDPNGTEDAPTVPGTITAVVLLRSPSPGIDDFVESEYETWCTAVGKRAILTGARLLTGGTATCTARLRSVRNVSPQPTASEFNEHVEVEFVFVPLDNWT